MRRRYYSSLSDTESEDDEEQEYQYTRYFDPNPSIKHDEHNRKHNKLAKKSQEVCRKVMGQVWCQVSSLFDHRKLSIYEALQARNLLPDTITFMSFFCRLNALLRLMERQDAFETIPTMSDWKQHVNDEMTFAKTHTHTGFLNKEDPFNQLFGSYRDFVEYGLVRYLHKDTNVMTLVNSRDRPLDLVFDILKVTHMMMHNAWGCQHPYKFDQSGINAIHSDLMQQAKSAIEADICSFLFYYLLSLVQFDMDYTIPRDDETTEFVVPLEAIYTAPPLILMHSPLAIDEACQLLIQNGTLKLVHDDKNVIFTQLHRNILSSLMIPRPVPQDFPLIGIMRLGYFHES